MADSRFFQCAGPFTLDKIAELTGAKLRPPKNGKAVKSVADVAPLESATPGHISFLDNVKYLDAFAESKAAACFVREKYADRAPSDMTLLITDDPYYAYALTAQQFYPQDDTDGISKHAHVAKSARLGKGTQIDAGAVIGDNVVIGEHCHIGANVTISHAIIGNHVTVKPGAHIGQSGFGWAIGKKGFTKVPQLGRVMIGNHVEIGAGTCIDRGAGPDTVIGDHTKIDNLVQIGHNVQVGQHVVIVSQVGISGSTKIGNGVMLGGQVGIAGHITIGDGAKLAAKSGVFSDVPAGVTYGGFPAIPTREWHKQTVTLTKMSKKGT